MATVLSTICIAAAPSQPEADSAPAEQAETAASHDLRPRFVEGRTSQYEFWGKRTTTSSTTMPWGERTMQRKMDSKGRMLWEVEQVKEDGSATCVMTLEWLTITMTQDEREPVTIDSREEPDDDDRIAKRIATFVGKPLRCEVGEDGTVRSVSGVDAIREDLEQIQNAGGPVDDAMFLEQAATLATIPGAEAALELQSTWQSTNIWPRDYGKISEPMEYRLNSAEHLSGIPIVTVNGQADLTFEPDEEKLAGGRVTIQMTEGRSTTQIMFDTQRHEVVGRNALETLRLEITAQTERISISSVIEENIQSQMVRVAESENGEVNDDGEADG